MQYSIYCLLEGVWYELVDLTHKGAKLLLAWVISNALLDYIGVKPQVPGKPDKMMLTIWV